MKIAFGFPHNGLISSQFHESVVGMLFNELNSPEDMRVLGSYFPQSGCYVGINRNKICTRFMHPSCTDDYLLMIDTDIEFPHHILYQFADLITANPGVEVIAGRANIGTGLPVFYRKSAVGYIEQCCQPFVGLQEFDKVGTGIILISRSALMKIYEKVHANFFTHLIIEGETINSETGEYEVTPRELGDDFSFCERAKAVGIKIYGAWEIFGQHYKPQPINSRYPGSVDESVIK